MKNFIQPGNTITLTAPADVLSGEPVNVGVFFGIAAYDALEGQPVETQLTGVFELPKQSGVAIDQGDTAYWDPSYAAVTNASTTNTIVIGGAVESVITSAPTVRVRLKGTAALDEDD